MSSTCARDMASCTCRSLLNLLLGSSAGLADEIRVHANRIIPTSGRNANRNMQASLLCGRGKLIDGSARRPDAASHIRYGIEVKKREGKKQAHLFGNGFCQNVSPLR